MKRIGLFAFGITTCVLVPTTLHLLQAGPVQVAKLVAPDQKSIQINGAKVDVSVDKAIVEPGGKVRVTLTATADTRAKLPLTVVVYEQEGMGAERTENPPVRVGRDEVTLAVANGKASKTLAFTLRGNRTADMGGDHPFGHYTVMVMSTKAADLMDRKLRHSRQDGFDPTSFDTSDDEFAKLGEIARLDVNTRAVSDHIQIMTGDIATAGDIAVKVRVTNPTRRGFDAVQLSLAAAPSDLTGEYHGIPAEQVLVDDNPDATFAMKPHETKDLVFHVHTDATGTLGLFATVACTGDDCWSEGKKESASRLNDSMLDAIDVIAAPSDAKPAAVAQTEQAK
jgi:hypothetical protein